MIEAREAPSGPVASAAVALGLALVAAVCAGCTTAADVALGEDVPPQTRVDLHEPFSGSRLDGSRWTRCYWWHQGEGCTNLSTGERQWYHDGNVEVDGGHLALVAEAEPVSREGRTWAYRSGIVTSGRAGDRPSDTAGYAFTFGSVEVRFRTPAGAGLWPAIWMLPATNEPVPEIDLLEQYGSDTRKASMTLHTEDAAGRERVDRAYARVADLSEGWHSVRLDWEPDRLTWTIDGEQVHEVTGSRVPREPMYLLFDLAVGGAAGEVDERTLPARFLIDDVTVRRAA